MSDKDDATDAFSNLQNYACDVESRRVFLHSPVYPTDTAEGHGIGTEHIIRSLLYLGAQAEPISLWINTPGGDLYEMWAIIDVMETMSCLVNTVAYGNVSSAGCLILACGTGRRYTMRHASFMWHAGTTDIGYLNWTEARDRMAWEERDNERWLAHMGRRTRPPGCKSIESRQDYWREWTRGRELWLDATGMKRHGIVDEILKKGSDQGQGMTSCSMG